MEWKEYQIQDVCRLINGRAYSNDEMLEHGKYKIVRVGNLSGGNSTWFYSDLELPADKYCHNGDLLFAWACTFGPHIWKEDNTIFHYHIWKIVEDKDVVDRRFFYYYLKFATGGFLGALNGSVMVHITKSSMEKMIIRIPKKLEDQRRIASILSSLDRKIELNNKINADLEEMAQAIFKNWFVDFEPFKDGKFVDSELGMIPEGWKVGCLGDMGAVVCGKTPSKSNSNYYGGDIPFIKIPDMHGNVFVENSEDRLTEEGSLSQIKKLIPPYSLMVSCIATVGLVSINTKPSHTNQQINTVIPHNKSALFYLYQHIKNNEEFLKNMGRGGTTTLNVNTKSFSNIRLLIPSEIALEQFHGIVEGLFKKIEQNLHESRTLSLLRDTLLPRLMSGELEIPE